MNADDPSDPLPVAEEPKIVCTVGWNGVRTTEAKAEGFSGGQPCVYGNLSRLKGGETNMLITYMRTLIAQLARDEEGQTAIEYALVLALIAVAIVVLVASTLTGIVPTILGKVTDALGAA